MSAQVEALKKSLKIHVEALAKCKKDLDKALNDVDKYFGQNMTLQTINENLLEELKKCRYISQTSQEKWTKLYHEQKDMIQKLKEQISKEEEVRSGIKRLRRMRVPSE